MTASVPIDRDETTGRDSTVSSDFTTYTNGPFWLAVMAWTGTTVAAPCWDRVKVVFTYKPGHRVFRELAKVPLRWIVPVVGSTALSTKVSVPSSGAPGSLGTAATTRRVPCAMYLFTSGRYCCGTVKFT